MTQLLQSALFNKHRETGTDSCCLAVPGSLEAQCSQQPAVETWMRCMQNTSTEAGVEKAFRKSQLLPLQINSFNSGSNTADST